MWRSPEAHAQGRINKPSDMFSFGIIVSIRPIFIAKIYERYSCLL